MFAIHWKNLGSWSVHGEDKPAANMDSCSKQELSVRLFAAGYELGGVIRSYPEMDHYWITKA